MAIRRVSLVAVFTLVAAIAAGLIAAPIAAQSTAAKPSAQKIDEEYTRIIKQNLQDPRITTELVDHLPASDTVPSPLKFLGRAVGTPGELTYAKDIYRYYEALAKASPRARSSGRSARPKKDATSSLLAIADEATIKYARQIPRHARRADRSAQDHRGAGAAAARTRRSRSTTRSAACTRPKPAAPRC